MPKSPTAELLKLYLKNADGTQREIAAKAGFAQPNVLSMMKSGETKVPLSRIPALAEACGEDAGTMIRVAMMEYHPETWQVLMHELVGDLTEDEQDLVGIYRFACGGEDIRMSEVVEEILQGVFGLALRVQREDDRGADLDELLKTL